MRALLAILLSIMQPHSVPTRLQMNLTEKNPRVAKIVVHKKLPESIARWHDLAISVGWTKKQWPTLACIIARESGGYPTAGYGKHDAIGLLQIKSSLHTEYTKEQLTDPEINLRLGHEMFLARHKSWQDWYYAPKPCY